MCLHVFCGGDKSLYARLAPHAQRLGAAFQKVNFLRDIQSDQSGLGRHYFPHWKEGQAFSEEIKEQIISEIKTDFKAGREGIVQLPRTCRTGVYAAYVYYRALLIRIARTPSSRLFQSRIRINNVLKLLLLLYAGLRIKWQGIK
jgi:phytoene/squalene synthetase